jgi:hypothetical protein
MEWINKSVTPDMFAGGFIRRCMFINRERSLRRQYIDRFPPPLDPLQANILAHQMTAWMMAKAPLEVELSKGAMKVYSQFVREWVEKCDSPPDSNLTYYYLGQYNFVMKLAMVLVVSRHTPPGLTPEAIHKSCVSLTMRAVDLEKAIELVKFEEPHLAECFTRIGEHRHAEQYRHMIKELNTYHANHQRPMPWGLFGDVMRKKYGADWKKRLEDLIETGDVRKARHRTSPKGRYGEFLWVPGSLPWSPEMWETIERREASE